MVLSKDQLKKLKEGAIEDEGIDYEKQDTFRNGVVNDNRKWPNGEVKFEIASNIGERHKNLIRNTLKGLTRKLEPCIQFVESNYGNR